MKNAAKALMPMRASWIDEIGLRIVDALHDMAEAAGIEPDEAQTIIATAESEPDRPAECHPA